ncbi:MAG: PHP domain-containing protein [Deltaproteobacteria bacterium]|nr:PHP domain-containing protein [Deltaproteobacteria bacterium]
MCCEFDLHLHTSRHSECSVMTPEEMVGRALEMGLDGIAITEHEYTWSDEEIRELVKKTHAETLIILAGQEVRCYEHWEIQGDFLVFGTRGNFYAPTARELIQRVHRSGGIVIAAHPYRSGLSVLGAGDMVYDLDIDALELHHPNHPPESVKKARWAMERLKIPGIGGSDAHHADQVGCCTTRFHREVHDLFQMMDEIRRGRVRALQRNFEFRDSGFDYF